MAKDFSPEERLLRLIRSKTPRQAPSGTPTNNAREEPFIKERHKPGPSPKPIRPLPPRDINREVRILKWENLNVALTVLLAGLLVYFVPLFFKRPKIKFENLKERAISQETVSGQKKSAGPENKLPSAPEARPSFDYFSGQVGAKNIFAPIAKEESQPQEAVEQGPKLEEVKGQLSLLGVISGATPQAIIEDKKTLKTYFLNKGESFEDIEVGDILDNKVILIYKGKQFELVL
jgi:hypothetical protein